MTIPNTARKAGPLLGTGSQTAWPFTFKVFAAGDVQVTIANSAGTETPLVLGTDYSVTLNSNQETSPGGTVTYPISGSALPVGSVLAIIGDLDYDQPLDLPSGGNFSPLALENQLDRTAMQIQQLAEGLSRAVKLPPTSSESIEELVDDLQRVADSAGNIDTVAGIAANVTAVANNIDDVIAAAEIDALYQGAKTSDPALRNDGSALQVGDLYFNTTNGEMRVYGGTLWKPGFAGTVSVQNFSGNGSATAFTLAAAPAGENNTQVYLSGVYQQKDRYSVSGTTLAFSSAPPSGTNNIEVVTISTLAIGETDAALVNFMPAGTGAVERTVQDELGESVKITQFGASPAKTAAQNAAAIQAAMNTGFAVQIPDGVFTTDTVYPAINQVVFGSGTLQSSGSNPTIEIAAGRTGIKLRGFKMRGNHRNDVSGNDTAVSVKDVGFEIDGVEIYEYAAFGIRLLSWTLGYEEMVNFSSRISGCYIHDNGCGIDTGAFEYVHIDNNRINGNGLNYAKTGFNTSGATTAGIAGGLSNIGVTNNLIGENAYGLYITGSSGANTDHNKIIGNTINHNLAGGTILVGLKNYVLFHGNTLLSNVIQPSASSVKYPPVNSSVDLALVDCAGLSIIGNAIGGGSFGEIPLYGVASCRWTNNNLFARPVEKRVPDNTQPIYTTYGYTVNADNRFGQNWFYGFDKPLFLISSARWSCVGNTENTLGLVDDYQYTPTMSANWQTPSAGGGAQLRYWREGGNRVRVCGSFSASNGSAASPAFVLPAGFRPSGFVQFPLIVDGAGTVSYGVIYSTGNVVVAGNGIGTDVSIDVTFVV